jgi:hypothetical protein
VAPSVEQEEKRVERKKLMAKTDRGTCVSFLQILKFTVIICILNLRFKNVAVNRPAAAQDYAQVRYGLFVRQAAQSCEEFV